MTCKKKRMLICFVFLLVFLSQCKQDKSDDSVAVKADLEAGDTISVSKFDIKRSDMDNSANWTVYSIYSDTVCLPSDWNYKIAGDSLFKASHGEIDGSLSFEIIRSKGNSDETAKSFLASKRKGAIIIKPDFLKKCILDEGILYESYPIVKSNNHVYSLGILMLVKNGYNYNIFLKLRDKYSKINNISVNDIVYNIRIDKSYVYSDRNKINKIII